MPPQRIDNSVSDIALGIGSDHHGHPIRFQFLKQWRDSRKDFQLASKKALDIVKHSGAVTLAVPGVQHHPRIIRADCQGGIKGRAHSSQALGGSEPFAQQF